MQKHIIKRHISVSCFALESSILKPFKFNSMKENPFLKAMRKHSDEELLEILNVKRNEYVADAIAAVKEVLKERGTTYREITEEEHLLELKRQQTNTEFLNRKIMDAEADEIFANMEKGMVKTLWKRIKKLIMPGNRVTGMGRDRLSTEQLIIRTLTEMGYKCKKEKDNDIHFQYLEYDFYIGQEKKNSNIIWIRNPYWAVFHLQDVSIEAMKEAVNTANEMVGITHLYTIDKEREIFALHCHMMLYFSEQIPYLDNYLGYMLDSMVAAHNRVKEIFKSIYYDKKQKHEKQ